MWSIQDRGGRELHAPGVVPASWCASATASAAASATDLRQEPQQLLARLSVRNLPRSAPWSPDLQPRRAVVVRVEVIMAASERWPWNGEQPAVHVCKMRIDCQI